MDSCINFFKRHIPPRRVFYPVLIYTPNMDISVYYRNLSLLLFLSAINSILNFNRMAIYSLTNSGISVIQKCSKSGFHAHDSSDTLFEVNFVFFRMLNILLSLIGKLKLQIYDRMLYIVNFIFLVDYFFIFQHILKKRS